MRLTTKRITLTFFFLSLFISIAGNPYALEDAIIAIVNDDVITYNDLKTYVLAIYRQLRMEGKSEAFIQEVIKDLDQNGLMKLIEDRLILSRANELEMTVRKELIDEKLAGIRKRYPAERQFLDALVSDGTNITQLREQITDQLKIKYMVEREVKSKLYVNPQEVTDYYKSHFDEYLTPERINLDSIFISFGESSEEARSKAAEAIALINEGTPFREAAEKFSERPHFGVVAKNQLLPEIEQAVFRLKIGDVSSIIALEDGLYIFQVKGKVLPEMAPLEDVKDEIYNKLFQQKFREKFTAWISELKDDAYIEIKE